MFGKLLSGELRDPYTLKVLYVSLFVQNYNTPVVSGSGSTLLTKLELNVITKNSETWVTFKIDALLFISILSITGEKQRGLCLFLLYCLTELFCVAYCPMSVFAFRFTLCDAKNSYSSTIIGQMMAHTNRLMRLCSALTRLPVCLILICRETNILKMLKLHCNPADFRESRRPVQAAIC
jgi:hypothetical protein